MGYENPADHPNLSKQRVEGECGMSVLGDAFVISQISLITKLRPTIFFYVFDF